MKREDLAKKLAEETGTAAAAARDQIDEVVNKIVQKLRKGQAAKLPGLGRLAPKGKKP